MTPDPRAVMARGQRPAGDQRSASSRPRDQRGFLPDRRRAPALACNQ